MHGRTVFLAGFDHLHLLDLDFCSIEILIADLNECTGMLISSYTKSGLLRNYIILNKSLLNSSGPVAENQLKIVGVHEFCHFIAILYAATVVSIEALKESILHRLNGRIDKLPKETLINLYNLLANKASDEYPLLDELTDRHFRLDVEGDTPDYNILFYHFMFSKDLFETDFTPVKQAEFKRLVETKDTQNLKTAVQLLVKSIETVSKAKCVPYKLAFNQVSKWVHSYVSTTA
ncbi:MAG: hypothetical protein LBU17_02785 [Treponema sp.]|nr:hypothetical protein [Treponema sp.]